MTRTKTNTNHIKLFILSWALINLLLPNIVLAQTTATYSGPEATISQLLCTPTPSSSTGNAASGDLYNCINKLYKFAIIIASIGGVLMVVIAGYMYMSAEGNQETVSSARGLITSTIVALAILFVGYVFLKALNPDLITFHTIAPPSAGTTGTTGGTGSTGGTGGTGGTGNTGSYNVGGYNIAGYATDPSQPATVQSVFNTLQSSSINFSDPNSIQQYMQRIVTGLGSLASQPLPLTGQMIINAAQQYNVDPKVIMAIIQTDSSYGSTGVGAKTHNPGNVGNTDNGSTKDYGDWQSGVNAVAAWLAAHKI